MISADNLLFEYDDVDEKVIPYIAEGITDKTVQEINAKTEAFVTARNNKPLCLICK